ncbi:MULTISPECIES: 4-hydroxyphenylpyruvate dioxygenase [Asticcacaulis]|uniref:4-hydroxyphenylpyruvate dioxygenase n=1 Tax=Asticcacaulis TaxID=76890 RepID=UPI001AE8368A|nr:MULTISPECIES: 4-hydroxyphenylpyruvate dioxygenase [Asticcacaulis]MBP2161551.1 4-hydroxyphenylpyruvate dioxygenase [Asticcacaulis solisilvae]MDR6802598.1 4-hydroxyphenylpyruvate dioxygenase [Asticcacaulis sp. BE141]
MSETETNLLGLDGFAFVEFTGPDAAGMAEQLEAMGFTAVARHPTKSITRYRQGRVDFVLNEAATQQASEFGRAHGPSANGMAFRVTDAARAYELALEKGARPADANLSAFPDVPVLEGIGGSLLYLIDHDVFAGWTPLSGAGAEAENSVGFGMIDHLTHNVRRGEMRTWSEFYRRIFGFEEQKYFDIKGQATGLFSQAMIAPDQQIRIPLNESQDDKSQIEEFLRQYNGEGIQHIALTTDNIYETVERLRARGVKLQDTIDTYYDLVDKRVPGHGEDLERLRRNRILIDGGGEDGILLQIFTENTFGPIFFEIIQRKGNDGFGNGNFQALFESIELDQIRRGVIKVA